MRDLSNEELVKYVHDLIFVEHSYFPDKKRQRDELKKAENELLSRLSSGEEAGRLLRLETARLNAADKKIAELEELFFL